MPCSALETCPHHGFCCAQEQSSCVARWPCRCKCLSHTYCCLGLVFGVSCLTGSQNNLAARHRSRDMNGGSHREALLGGWAPVTFIPLCPCASVRPAVRLTGIYLVSTPPQCSRGPFLRQRLDSGKTSAPLQSPCVWPAGIRWLFSVPATVLSVA